MLVGMVPLPSSLGVDNEEDYVDNNFVLYVHALDQFAGKKVVIAGGDSAAGLGQSLDGIADWIHRRDAFQKPMSIV